MNKEDRLIIGFTDLLNKRVLLNKIKMEDSLKDYKPSEVHCIEYIGKNPDSNVTRLADAFYMTNGAISKLTQKLMKRGIIKSYQKPDNKKEIYFRLTKKGDKVAKIHDELHREFRERDGSIFNKITDEEFDIMLKFSENYNRHLDAEIKKTNIKFNSTKLTNIK